MAGRKSRMDITQEEKELLIRDLCGRLPYGVKAKSQTSHLEINTVDSYFVDGDGRKMFHLSEPDFWQTVDNFQYYLRPMSSMTDKEKSEWVDGELEVLKSVIRKRTNGIDNNLNAESDSFSIDWLNAHHFDFRSLINKGLVLEAPAGMY